MRHSIEIHRSFVPAVSLASVFMLLMTGGTARGDGTAVTGGGRFTVSGQKSSSLNSKIRRSDPWDSGTRFSDHRRVAPVVTFTKGQDGSVHLEDLSVQIQTTKPVFDTYRLEGDWRKYRVCRGEKVAQQTLNKADISSVQVKGAKIDVRFFPGRDLSSMSIGTDTGRISFKAGGNPLQSMMQTLRGTNRIDGKVERATAP